MRVAKWGNSLAVRLPKKLVQELGLADGDEIEVVRASAGRLEVAVDRRREEALARMAARQWVLPETYRFDREEANER